jgi:hypothetical protein
MDVVGPHSSSFTFIHDVRFCIFHTRDDFTACEAIFSVLWVPAKQLNCHITNIGAAPAAKAVEYNKVKFNNTMGEGSPYVGSGPEVDKAWHAISYDSKYRS